jgi:uncharacterized protein YehS (DUF1456 family)
LTVVSLQGKRIMGIRYEIEELLERFAPLYHQYPDRTEPQKCYLEMDWVGLVTVNWNVDPRGDPVPMDVWNKGRLRWSLSPYADGQSLYEFLQSDQMRSLLERVHEGHITDWYNAELVGHLTEDAEEASLQIESVLHNKPYLERKIYSKKEWVKSNFLVDDVIADGNISSYIKKMHEKMEDIEKAECALFLDGLIYEEIEKSCVGYLERSMEDGNKPDEKAFMLAQMLADYDREEYGDLPERYDARFGNTLPFNRDGHFDDGVPASRHFEQTNAEDAPQDNG